LKADLKRIRLGAPALRIIREAPPRLRRLRLAADIALLAIAIAACTFYLTGKRAAQPLPLKFTQLTDMPGQEMFPSLAPDGRFVAFASRISGNWDIYTQRVNGGTAVNLTRDARADDTQPAFSPDGERIAFRSERNGGGIFVMGSNGDSVRRVTDFGYNPTWSPDGQEILFATESITRPEDRFTTSSRIWAVKLVTGEKRLITDRDAVQPSWSPHGRRIAFWGIDAAGQRDLWTVAADGSPGKNAPVAVTHDAATDWSPAWSRDGKHLYFCSNRGGSMNVWRIAVDEDSGRTLGEAEPLTTPSADSGQISVAGSRMAYVQQMFNANVQRFSFDPQSETVAAGPLPVTQGSKQATRPDISPDGLWIAFTSFGHHEDLYAVAIDGSGLRQLAEDGYKDRGPRWAPDGKRIAFFSNRSGNWQIWTVNSDGSNLQQVTRLEAANVAWPVWSPDGNRLAYTIFGRQAYITDLRRPWQRDAEERLPELPNGDVFSPWSWSPDGRTLAGFRQRSGRPEFGITLYSPEARSFADVIDYGVEPMWLADSRRLLFQHQGRLHIVDSGSKRVRQVLSVSPHEISARGYGITRDNRTLCVSVAASEADIWLVDLK
jgi:Tol biopolymer transport system component